MQCDIDVWVVQMTTIFTKIKIDINKLYYWLILHVTHVDSFDISLFMRRVHCLCIIWLMFQYFVFFFNVLTFISPSCWAEFKLVDSWPNPGHTHVLFDFHNISSLSVGVFLDWINCHCVKAKTIHKAILASRFF